MNRMWVIFLLIFSLLPGSILAQASGEKTLDDEKRPSMKKQEKEAASSIDTAMIRTQDPDSLMHEIVLRDRGKVPAQEEILVTVFPNPFTPNDDGYNDYTEFTFSESNERKSIIQIFNIRGKKVIELDGYTTDKYLWNGKDSNGNDAEPGVYIFIFRYEDKQISNGTI